MGVFLLPPLEGLYCKKSVFSNNSPSLFCCLPQAAIVNITETIAMTVGESITVFVNLAGKYLLTPITCWTQLTNKEDSPVSEIWRNLNMFNMFCVMSGSRVGKNVQGSRGHKIRHPWTPKYRNRCQEFPFSDCRRRNFSSSASVKSPKISELTSCEVATC